MVYLLVIDGVTVVVCDVLTSDRWCGSSDRWGDSSGRWCTD